MFAKKAAEQRRVAGLFSNNIWRQLIGRNAEGLRSTANRVGPSMVGGPSMRSRRASGLADRSPGH